MSPTPNYAATAAAHRAHLNPPWIFVLSALWILGALFFVLKSILSPLQNISSRLGGRFFTIGLPRGFGIEGNTQGGKGHREDVNKREDVGGQSANQDRQRATKEWKSEGGVVQMRDLERSKRHVLSSKGMAEGKDKLSEL